VNTSKIANILHLFNSHHPIDVYDRGVLIVKIYDSISEPDNEVVCLTRNGKHGEDYRVKFTKQGLSNARVEDGNLVMEDTEGDEITIAFMETRKHSLVAEDID